MMERNSADIRSGSVCKRVYGKLVYRRKRGGNSAFTGTQLRPGGFEPPRFGEPLDSRSSASTSFATAAESETGRGLVAVGCVGRWLPPHVHSATEVRVGFEPTSLWLPAKAPEPLGDRTLPQLPGSECNMAPSRFCYPILGTTKPHFAQLLSVTLRICPETRNDKAQEKETGTKTRSPRPQRPVGQQCEAGHHQETPRHRLAETRHAQEVGRIRQHQHHDNKKGTHAPMLAGSVCALRTRQGYVGASSLRLPSAIRSLVHLQVMNVPRLEQGRNAPSTYFRRTIRF